MTTTEPTTRISETPLATQEHPIRPGAELPTRLTALARLIQIGGARSGAGGFDPALLGDAETMLARAGERLRLSASHTVVALAGGTGSGKSSLFNAIAGVDLSPVGVTRPQTMAPHACVWGLDGAGPLLEWLGVERRYRYARASALDRGEESLAGLVLLDLPDHDSVMAATSNDVDRLISVADLLVWVLDPQKYADAAVHRRYFGPLAGHTAVTVVVLNQADRLSDEETEECLGDLRRLLDSEGLHDPRPVVTSAKTGAGVDELCKVLVETVSMRRASSERIAADIDALVPRFSRYTREELAPASVDAASTSELVEALASAAGVPALCEALRGAYELRAADYVGWPFARLVERLPGRDPLRKMRLTELRDALRSMTAGPVGAQQAEIDNTLAHLTDDVAESLPAPWSKTVRDAARSRSDQIPSALGAVLAESLPAANRIPSWWRLVRAWHWMLVAAVVAAFAWIGVLLAFGAFHVAQASTPLLDDVTLLPWVGVMIAAILLLGWLTASGCQNVVMLAADREQDRVDTLIRSRVAAVAREEVLMPIEQELSEYARFREMLATALAKTPNS